MLWKPQLSQRVPEAKTETDSIITEDKNRLTSLQQETTESRHVPITPKLDKAESHSGALKESTVQKEAPVQNTDFDHAAFEREYLRSKPPTLADNEEVYIIASEETRHVSTATEKRNDKAIIEGTLNNESVRWNPDLDIKDQLGLLVDEIPPKSNFSWFRLMVLVVPGALVLFFIRAFVISEAQTVFPDSTNSNETVEQQVSQDDNAPVPTNTQSDALYDLESSLKSKLRSNTQNVTPEQSLSDALRIELEYVGLDIVRIDARVLKWKGRLLNQPKSASISIVINSNGEVETEFILASLVIAKYTVRYYLEMPRFTIVIQDGDLALTKTISTEKAQFLYLQPGSLKDFIAALSESP